MLKRGYYYYNEDLCSFEREGPVLRRLWFHAASVLAGAVLLSLVCIGALDRATHSPGELALQEENDALRMQLVKAQESLGEFDQELSVLVDNDQHLFRVLLGVEPIPEDMRQVGVGGTDPYEMFDRFSSSTADLLRTTSEMIDQIERRINLQNTSSRELRELAALKQQQIAQLPAIRPMNVGQVTSGFGMRKHPILGHMRHHNGVDIPVPEGTPVHATADGTVEKLVRSNAALGYYIVVRHPEAGFKTMYAHLSSFESGVRRRSKVKRGDVIGYSGNTGLSTAPHLHYEVQTLDGGSVDPETYLSIGMTPEEFWVSQAKKRGSKRSLD